MEERRILGKKTSWWAGAILLLLTLSLYLWTLDDGLEMRELKGGDLITHQYAQVQGRFSNAPGYPLYTMGGWVWFHGWRTVLGNASNPVRILSSYSTLWAILSLLLLYTLALRLTKEWKISFLVTAFYAVTYFFWYYAVTTEEYSSAVAQTLLFVWLLWKWDEKIDEGDEKSADRYVYWIALLTGVGLAHIVTVLFIVPGIVWYMLTRKPEYLKRYGFLAKVVGIFLLPLLSYTYVYVRGAQHPEWRGVGHWNSTWQWFWSFVSTQQGRAEMARGYRIFPIFTREFPAITWNELTPVVLLGGLIGLLMMRKRDAVCCYATLVIYFFFCYIDRFGNWFQVIMPAYPLIVLGFGVLAAKAYRWEPGRKWAGILPKVGVILLLAALVGYRGLKSYPRADCSNRPADNAFDKGWLILSDDPAPKAAIAGTEDEFLSLEYVTQIWGWRKDVRPVSPDEMKRLWKKDDGTPLYVTSDAAGYIGEVIPGAKFDGAGIILVALEHSRRHSLPDGAMPARRYLGDGMALAGWQIRSPARLPEHARLPKPAKVRRISLYLKSKSKPKRNWSLSFRAVEKGKELCQCDHQNPALGTVPTSSIHEGELVRDDFPILASGADSWRLILYRPLGKGKYENLSILSYPIRK